MESNSTDTSATNASNAAAAQGDAAPVAPRKNVLRRLYDWVLHWSDTPYGTPALFLISFTESSFFPIPPDVLQIALSAGRPKRSFYYAGVSAVASVLGACLGWFIGWAMWSAVGDFFIDYVPGVTQKNIDYVGGLYRENAFFAIFAAAFTPIPFKVFTIAAGIFSNYVPFTTLILASAVGRSLRFFSVATCIYFLGPSVRQWLEKYFEIATVAFLVLLVGGFLAIKWLL